MSAEIISFPFKAQDFDQQRWIPVPRARQAPRRPVRGWLRLAGIVGAVLSSWLLVIGTARVIAALF
ncbi:MAG: hypothetical protein JWO51_4868 [Rhodospirillales bacterium]|nr:hypothetical protein [Rhodospirillales bacterium]